MVCVEKSISFASLPLGTTSIPTSVTQNGQWPFLFQPPPPSSKRPFRSGKIFQHFEGEVENIGLALCQYVTAAGFPPRPSQIRLRKATERDVLVNPRESVCWTWLVQSNPMPFTFYFYSLIQFFNFRTKIPLRSRKTAIAQTPTPPNGHWPFCVTKVGMDVVPQIPENMLSDTIAENCTRGNLAGEKIPCD